MDQLRIIFKTLQGIKSTDEAEIGLDQTLLPLKDVISLQNLEEQLQSSPDFRKKLVCWHIFMVTHVLKIYYSFFSLT